MHSTVISWMIHIALHALHAGDLQYGLAKALRVLAQNSEVISSWHDGTINTFQFGTNFGDISLETVINYTV